MLKRYIKHSRKCLRAIPREWCQNPGFLKEVEHQIIPYSSLSASLKCLWSKNNCHLFERFFKEKKNGIFLLGISFFVIEIFTFLCYANEESDDIIDGSTKTVRHSIKNISRNITALFFKLGSSRVVTAMYSGGSPK